MNLKSELQKLQRLGCFPSLYLRGDVWRAHVNRAGNYWADAADPAVALREAVELWDKAGRPMDGEASASS